MFIRNKEKYHHGFVLFECFFDGREEEQGREAFP
jgi:hypothetical protein